MRNFLIAVASFFKKKYYSDIFIIAVFGLLVLVWFGKATALGIGDFNIRFDRLKYFKLLFSLWDSTVSFGASSPSQPAQIMPHGIFTGLSLLLHLPLAVFERLTFFYWFVGGGVSFYFLLREFNVIRIARLFGSLLYMMNPFTLLVVWHLNNGRIQEPYILAPLVLLLFVKISKKEKISIKEYIGYAFLWLLATVAYSGPNYLFLHMIPVSIYFFLEFVNSVYSKNWYIFLRNIKRAAGLSLLFIILNLFWLIPFILLSFDTLQASKLSAIISNQSAFKLASVSVLDAFQLKGLWSLESSYKGDPFYSWATFYGHKAINVFLFIIPLVSVVSIFGINQKKEKKYILFSLITMLIAVFLVKGANDPFSWLNNFIYSKSTFISSGFRSPFLKFGIILSIAVCSLFAFGIEFILLTIKKGWIKGVVLVFIGSVFFVINMPFFNGKVIYQGGVFLKDYKVVVPEEYNKLNEYLTSDTRDDGRVIIAPLSKTNKTFVNWYNGGYFDKWFSAHHPVINANTGGDSFILPDIYAKEIEKFKPEYKSELNFDLLFYLMNAKYVLYHRDSNWDYIKGHSWFYEHDQGNVENFISNKIKNFSTEVLTNDYYSLYQNKNFIDDKIYIPQKTTLIDGGNKSLVKYLSIEKLKKKIAFVFSEDLDSTLLLEKYPATDYFMMADNSDATINSESNLNISHKISLGQKEINYQIPTGRSDEVKLFSQKGDLAIDFDDLLVEQKINDYSFEGDVKKEDVIDASVSLPGKPDYIARRNKDAYAGNYSLELKTANHTVGYRKKIPINSSICGKMFISFKYKNVNGNAPKFAIVERGATSKSKPFHLEDKETWIDFSKPFDIDCNAKSFDLYFYSENLNQKESSNLFDDIHLYKVLYEPNVIGQAKLSEVHDSVPVVNFSKESDTKYLVKIKDVSNVFTLAFLESFNKNWLLLNQRREVGEHFEINGYANGWYVDPVQLCKNDNTACAKNADGTYDMEMTIEFFPQRWFYLGLLISGTTLLSCLGYLTYDFSKRNKQRISRIMDKLKKMIIKKKA